MSVLIEAVCLVIKAESIQAKYQGGWEQFKADYLKTGFCSDDELVSVSFGSILEAVSQIDVLELKGLRHQEEGRGEDIVIVDQLRGFLDPNPWAEFPGCYVIETNSIGLSSEEIWGFYMKLNEVEAAFRCMKTDLGTRPIHH